MSPNCLVLVYFATILFAPLTAQAEDKNIKTRTGPWQIFEPGRPLAKSPRIDIINQGEGQVIEVGDLVQLNLRTHWSNPEPNWRNDGDWWTWIGFSDKTKTNFFNREKLLANALIGQRQGAQIEFLTNGDSSKHPQFVARVTENPIGDREHFSLMKNLDNSSIFYIYTGSKQIPKEFESFSQIEILRICKAKAMYRTVNLTYDAPAKECIGSCCYLDEGKKEWKIEELKLEAVCSDGRVAKFEYGPIEANSNKIRTAHEGLCLHAWLLKAWKNMPPAVEVK